MQNTTARSASQEASTHSATRPTLGVQDARRLLRLPEHAALDLAELPDGRFNWCWKATSGQGRYLLKLNTDQGISHLRRLERSTRRAAQVGVQVPPVDRVGIDPGCGPFLVQSWLDGQTLSDWLEAGDADECDPLPWAGLGRQIGLLHSSELAGVRSPARIGRSTRMRELRGMLTRTRRAGILDASLAEATLHRATTLLDEMVDHEPVFCHLDIHPRNVLVTGPGGVALLDFDHARPTDPVYDFVKVQMWCAQRPEEFRLVLHGYEQTRTLRRDQSFWSALAFYRIVNHLSYCLYWSHRDPRHVGEWIAALMKEIETP
jgi:aminoglycoside phosphotransferase (APT) family kinase protein